MTMTFRVNTDGCVELLKRCFSRVKEITSGIFICSNDEKDELPESDKERRVSKESLEVQRESKLSDRKASFEAFFIRKRRMCPACHTKVVATNSAGGRNKRYHVDCVPKTETPQ